MSLDVTIIYKKPKMVKYNATHAACSSTFIKVVLFLRNRYFLYASGGINPNILGEI